VGEQRGTIGIVLLFEVVVAALILFAVGVVATGRGGNLGPAAADRRFVELPADQSLTADDLETVRLGVGFRGYRMDEVDALLDRLSQEIAERDARISELQSGPPAHPSVDRSADPATEL
jgi:DivIVA domain-containing protein